MADYIVSEEILRQVLDALEEHEADAMTEESLGMATHCADLLRTILASPPAEPMARAWRPNDKWGWSFDMRGLAVGLPEGYESVPLYRKDAT
jgi:hypothetical protein